MNKKIVISPSNTRTIAFLEELSKKKEAIKRKLESRSLGKVMSDGNAVKRTGK